MCFCSTASAFGTSLAIAVLGRRPRRSKAATAFSRKATSFIRWREVALGHGNHPSRSATLASRDATAAARASSADCAARCDVVASTARFFASTSIFCACRAETRTPSLPFQGLRLAQLFLQPSPLLGVGRGLEPPGQLGDALIELGLVLLQRLLPLAQRLLLLLELAAVALDDDGQLVRRARLVVVAGDEREEQRCGERALHAASVARTLARRISQSGTGFAFPFSFTGSRGAASTSEATLS